MKHSATQSNIQSLSVALFSSGKYFRNSTCLNSVIDPLASKSRHPWENNNIDFISMAQFPLNKLEKNKGGGVDSVLTRAIFDLTNK